MSIIYFVEECNPTCAANEYHATLLICGLWDVRDRMVGGKEGHWEWCWLSRRRSLHGNGLGDFILWHDPGNKQNDMGLDPNSNSTNKKEHANWTKAYDDCVLYGGWILMLVDQCTTWCLHSAAIGPTRLCLLGSSFSLDIAREMIQGRGMLLGVCDGGVIYMPTFLKKRSASWDSFSQRFMLVNMFECNNGFDPQGTSTTKSLA